MEAGWLEVGLCAGSLEELTVIVCLRFCQRNMPAGSNPALVVRKLARIAGRSDRDEFREGLLARPAIDRLQADHPPVIFGDHDGR